MSGASSVNPLHRNQMRAVEPEETVWLSASAGTGKTQVLSSRVLRLLLQEHVDPSQILCLTFTKAGATEMAARINSTLADWVRLPEIELFQRLEAIGAPSDPDTLARARTLFASVLDCPGGGLRIDTIHAFSQWLLGAFPLEAELTPGTRAMEDRDRILLLRQVLADLLVEAESRDPDLLDALAGLSLRMGPEEVERYLLRCAEAREVWFGAGSWQDPMRPRINQLLGLEADADAGHAAMLCEEAHFDIVSLRRCQETLEAWDSATGREGAAAIANWLLLDPAGRAETIDLLHAGLFTKSAGVPKQLNNILKRDPDYEGYVLRVGGSIDAVRKVKCLLALAERLVPALRLGRAFALAWDEAKRREGLIDFDDQIRIAARLLSDAAQADWIRYKLDRRFDHILVDEAQDTNAAQWRIIDALSGDFFAGEGQHGGKLRTLFVVGDYKQAIFRFQGTSPENFEAARRRVKRLMLGAVENMRAARGVPQVRELREYGLDRSFRTAQPVLDFVDAAIAHVGHSALGLKEAPERHEGEKRPGYVALWRPIGLRNEGEEIVEEAEEDGGGPNWLSRPDRNLADKIAQQIRHWMEHGFPLVKGGERRATAGDVMVLVRKRRELAGLIVARLHAAGVPVAGVDRLRLGAPLAVRDLVAALRFAAQPLDDLNLATLLVSPLIGWTQEQLLEHAYRDRVSLWTHLRQSRHPDVATAMVRLAELLARADMEPPQALLHWLLAGPWQGRKALIARLGREANDPIDELLNAASAYASGATPSLVGFIRWFDAGEGELKREAGASADLVRVMTVHGSKGLQAPIVILADATGNPDAGMAGLLDLADPMDAGRRIPLPSLREEERAGRIAAEHEARKVAESEEHWRLLYVAMTRAEEALFIGGALGSREEQPSPKSWYAPLSEVFESEWVEDTLWGGRREWGALAENMPPALGVKASARQASPAWLVALPPAEPRPARPLAPSALGEDVSPDPPFPPGAGRDAARRGTIIHKLLERLPELPPEARAAAAARWLDRNAPDIAEAERVSLASDALTVLSHPDWMELFSPQGLAEVPIAALVGKSVVAGTIDRLLIEPQRIRIVDFKTARRPPETAGEVPAAIMRQMAAYVAALEVTHPGRRVEAALLYTAVPRLIELPGELLTPYKRTLLSSE